MRGGVAAPGPNLVRQREVVEAFIALQRGGDFEGLLGVLVPMSWFGAWRRHAAAHAADQRMRG